MFMVGGYLFSSERAEKGISVDYTTIPMVGQSALIGIISPIFQDPDLLVLLDEIVHRESGGNPDICNKEFGCIAGMGLVQLIPSTLKYCENKLGRELNPFNPVDNLDCGFWLLENEGIRHWEQWSGPYILND